ncbi:MAG: MFS transporter [Candidatus Binataceae bacterium]
MATFPAYSGPRPLRPEPPRASIWTPFTQRLFFWLWIAALASNVGTWMQNVGAAWLMTTLSASPLMVALIQTAASLPVFLLALPAGALADLLDRRHLLLFSQGWMLVAAGLLGLLTLAGTTTPAALLGLSFALGMGSALNAPTWQAIVPEIADRDNLTPAIAAFGVNFNIARAIGPALGGIIVSLLGAGANFLLNAASFLGVMAVLYGWKRVHNPGVLPTERMIGAMRTGVRYVRYSPPLRAVLMRTGAFILGASALWAVMPLIARDELGLGATGYGVLLASFGAGAVLGGSLMPQWDRYFSRDLIVAIVTVIFAAAAAALALVRSVPISCAVMAAAGASWTTTMSEFNVAAQLSVPQWVRGRALSWYQIVMQGGMTLGSVAWGAFATRWGVPAALLCSAPVIGLTMLTTIRYRLATASTLTLEPRPPMPLPEVAAEVPMDRGPILVTVEYLINLKQAAEFERAMLEWRTVRRRDGATFWGLFTDAAAPNRYLEYFLVDTWVEHLRQHERGTLADLALQAYVRSFHIGQEPPVVTHQVAASVIQSR